MALEQGTRVSLLLSQRTINSPWSPGGQPLCVQPSHYLCSLFLINSLLSEILCLEILFQPPHRPRHLPQDKITTGKVVQSADSQNFELESDSKAQAVNQEMQFKPPQIAR